jgi:diguanylate cyclase (GGDEF)-like protein
VHQEIHDLNEQARQVARRNLPEAIRLATEAARQAQEAGSYGSAYTAGLAESWHQLGRFHMQLAEYDKALSFLGQAQQQYEQLGDRENLAAVFNLISATYALLADYAEAFNYQLKGLEEAQRSGNRLFEGRNLNDLGCILNDTGDHARALPYLERGLTLFKDLNDIEGQSMIFDGLAQAYLGLARYTKALESGLESIRLCQQASGRSREAGHRITVGRIYGAMAEVEPARLSFMSAFNIAKTAGYRREESVSLRYLGDLNRRNKLYTEALSCLQPALDIANEIRSRRDQYECHGALAAYYRDMRDFENALIHHEAFHTIKESVFNDQNNMRLRSLEVQNKLQTAQQEAEIYHLRNVALEREIAERKKAETALLELAATDVLTGLSNRRHILDLAHSALAISQRYKRPLSIMMLDVNRFKSINDTYGHAIGDVVLTEFAVRIKPILRLSDLVGRYGGDEFVIILPETDITQARLVAHRLQLAITNLPIQVKDSGLYISTSIGISSNETDYALALDTLIERADNALYAVKSGKTGPIVAFEPVTKPL